VQTLRTEIQIQAPPEKIWQILIDLAKYPVWNPFITQAIGRVEVGARVEITVPSGSKEMKLHCRVIKAEPRQVLCWKYHVISPLLFRGEHSFTIEPMGSNYVRFVDQEIFNGLLVPMQAKEIDSSSRQGFEAMDKALKIRAEQS
jgi:hypothetical protein